MKADEREIRRKRGTNSTGPVGRCRIQNDLLRIGVYSNDR